MFFDPQQIARVDASMDFLNLDSPIAGGQHEVLNLANRTVKRKRTRKRSFEDMQDSDDSGESLPNSTPTKRRKSAEGFFVDKPRDFIYVTPKPDSIRHEETVELRPEGTSTRTKPKKRKADVFLFDFYLPVFKTPGSERNQPIEAFSLDDDVEEDNELVPNNPLKTPFVEEDTLNLDMDNSNDGHEFLRKQSEVLPKTQFEKDFASLASSLNFKKGRFENVKSISCQEVRDLLVEGQHHNLVILDCRFEYEFFGGHLQGATRCAEREAVEKVFKKYEHQRDVKFILHCELSVCRAPRAANYLACLFDRYVGRQPELLVMQGGFSRFWKLFHNDELSNKIFGISGYVREDSQLLQCRTCRRNANKGWSKVLVRSCEVDEGSIEIC